MYVSVSECVCVCARARACMSVCAHARTMYVHTRTYMHVRECLCVRVYAYMRARLCIKCVCASYTDLLRASFIFFISRQSLCCLYTSRLSENLLHCFCIHVHYLYPTTLPKQQ